MEKDGVRRAICKEGLRLFELRWSKLLLEFSLQISNTISVRKQAINRVAQCAQDGARSDKEGQAASSKDVRKQKQHYILRK